MTATTIENAVRHESHRYSQRRKSPRTYVATVLSYVFLVILTVTAIIPLVVMIATSFKPSNEIYTVPPTLFAADPTLTNYVKVLMDSAMPQALLNSVAVGLLTTVLTLLLGCTTGYALARIRFKGGRQLGVALLLGQLLPTTVLLLPIYQLISALGLLDTIPGLALSYLVFVLPVVTWLLNSTFKTVPIELEQAAMIDGCSRLQAVIKVVLPIAAPGIVSVGIFAFLQAWNEFLFASVLTSSMASKTAPIALTDFANNFTVDWGATMTGATVISVPITIVFLFFQKYFIRGMASGAVKG